MSQKNQEQIDFDLHDAIEAALSPFWYLARRRGVELRVVIDPAVPPALHGDPNWLRLTLLNLIGPAFQNTEKGWVELSVKTTDDSGHRLQFDVREVSGVQGSSFTAEFGAATEAGHEWKPQAEFDPQQIVKLAGIDAGGESLAQVLAQDFFTNGLDLVRKIRASIQNQDTESMRQFAHALRSPSSCLGLLAMAQVCAQLEETKTTGKDLQQLGGRVVGVFERSTKWLRVKIQTVRAS